MQHLRFHVTSDVERFGKKICNRCAVLFYFASLHLPIRCGHFFDCFKLVLIRNPEHRSDHILFAAPRRCDVGDRFIAPLQPLLQYAGDHCERNEKQQNERPDPEQLVIVLLRFPKDGCHFGNGGGAVWPSGMPRC
jgi:hypothetical protein